MGPATAGPLIPLLEDLGRLGQIRLGAPERMWIALPILAAILLAPALRRRAYARGRLLPVLLRVALSASLLAVLLEPQVAESEELDGRTLVLADVSPSVGAAGIEEQRRYLAEAPAPFDLATYGAGASLRGGATTAADLEPDPRLATDLPGALRLAAARAAPDRPLRVVLLGDGRPTVAGSEEAAARLRRLGASIAVHGVAGAPALPPDLSIASLRVVEREQRDDPLAFETVVRAAEATHATLHLYVDGNAVARRDVDVVAGDNTVRFEGLVLAPGRYFVQALAEGDATPADNVRGIGVDVPGVPSVLFLAKEPRRSLLADALALQGMKTRVVAAADPGDLSEYDLFVFLPDAPVDALEARAGEWSDRVGRRGRGLLAVGGREGDGLARLAGSPLAFLLPLEVPPRPPRDEPAPAPPAPTPEPHVEVIEEKTQAYPISLCLVVDRSGSMRGEKIRQAVAAAIASAETLTQDDRVSVIVFGDEAKLVLGPIPGGNPGALRRDLSSLEPTGMTAMFTALRLGAALLDKEPTPIRHLLLISDGEPTDEGAWKSLVEAMAERKITVSAVGIGFQIDARLLGNLAQWGRGKYWSAIQPYEIPQVVTQDTRRVVAERNERGKKSDQRPPEKPTPRAPEPPPNPPEPPAPAPPPARLTPDPGAPLEMLKGIDPTSLPGIGGIEEGKPRFAAWVAARAGEDGPPVLAYRRTGLGTVAVLTLDPEKEGGRDLREFPDFPRMMGQLARSMLPEAGGSPFLLEVEAQDGELLVRITGEDGIARTDVALEASLDGAPLRLVRRGDRYGAPLPERHALASLVLRADGPVARTMILPASEVAEMAHPGSDRALLARLAGGEGALDAPAAEALALPHLSRTRSRPVSFPFLLLAAILFPFDAWARRRAASASR